ncbi:MAG: hypothetical protein H7Y88_12830 [Phycisphaerales bacterium]|nr:hypothetical protein [Phycisphaerales bacterium]
MTTPSQPRRLLTWTQRPRSTDWLATDPHAPNNPLAAILPDLSPETFLRTRSIASRLIARSGAGTTSIEPGDALPAWLPAAWDQFELALATLPADAPAHLLIAPHHAHTISDIPSALRYLERWSSKAGPIRFGLALDPAAILAPSMLAAAPDHLGRIFAALGSHPATACLCLTGDLLDHVTADHLRALIDTHVPPTTPIILEPGAAGDALRQLLT